MKNCFKRSELVAVSEVDKYKSYGLAAKNLNIAQTNLSRTITTVEERIGLKIFERDTRPIRTTQFGSEFIDHIKKTLDAMEELSSFAENYKQSLNDRVNICAPTGILIYLARHILPKVREARPEIGFRLTTYNTTATTGITVREDADITFTYSAPTNEPLVAKRIAGTALDVYSTEDTLLRYPVSDIRDYERYPCIRLTEKAEQPDCWCLHDKNESKEIRLSVNGNYVVDNYMTGLELARTSNHFFLAPKILVNEMNALDLKPGLPSHTEAFGSVYMVYRPKAYLPYRISVVTELISKLLGDDFSM